MNSFLRRVHHRMNRNLKFVKIFSKQLKRKERKYTTPTNYLILLKILKNHGMLWKI